MQINNRRDMLLTMDRNIRQAKTRVRSGVKRTSGVSNSLVDSLNNKLTSQTAADKTNPYNNLLKKERYNQVKETSKQLREEVQSLLKNQEDRDSALQGVSKFTGMYNSLLQQIGKLGSNNMNLYAKELQGTAEKYRSQLQKMGIEVQTDGTFQVDYAKLPNAEFKSWYDFLEEASGSIAKIQTEAESNLYSLSQSQTIYGTNYNRYGQEDI